jgi:hypothetical protein
MIISSTTFPHKDIHEVTWKLPDGNTANQIDHVIIQKRFRSCITDVRSFRGANCDTDHFLILATLRINLLGLKRQSEKRNTNLKIEAIKDPEVQRKCMGIMDKNIKYLYLKLQDIDSDWNKVNKILMEIAE